jgi:hypothetical protein
LFGPLAGGNVFRWFAVNIPQDLCTGGRHFTDLDAILRYHDHPRSNHWFYKTWEVKVYLIQRDGKIRNARRQKKKLEGVIEQMGKYRAFGSPDVTLLEVYVCEDGFRFGNDFPNERVKYEIRKKVGPLQAAGFGYQLLPFEHGTLDGRDAGLFASSNTSGLPAIHDVLRARKTWPCSDGFNALVERLDYFFESQPDNGRKSFSQIVFCRNCLRLQLIQMKDGSLCTNCKDDLVQQS